MRQFNTVLAIIGLVPGLAFAGNPNSFEMSPDITIDIGSSVATDEDVISEGFPVFLGDLPGNADLTAFHRLPNSDALFALDITVMLPGGQLCRPGDVIRHDGSTYSLEFDGFANGVPTGARIDALSVDDNGKLILSFDVTLMLDGDLVADEDLTKFDGAGFDQVFDASAQGINGALDLDAVHFEPVSQLLLVSFDSGGSVAGIPFADEDLLLFNPINGQWSLAFDGSASDSAWVAANLDATFAVLSNGDVIFYGGFESLIGRDPERPE